MQNFTLIIDCLLRAQPGSGTCRWKRLVLMACRKPATHHLKAAA